MSSSLRLAEKQDSSMLASTSRRLLRTMELHCKNNPSEYEHTEVGIEALRQCVKALQDYASQVSGHESESMAAHGQYRKSFIQTYALLKSIVGEKDKINKFEETFSRDHEK